MIEELIPLIMGLIVGVIAVLYIRGYFETNKERGGIIGGPGGYVSRPSAILTDSEIIIPLSKPTRTCVSCGASNQAGACEYCGTSVPPIKLSFEEESAVFMQTIQSKKKARG